MTRPNRYVLGSTVEISSEPEDTTGVFFVPQESRLSIEEPDGNIITVSGAGLTVASGFLYYLYKTEVTGWVQYEYWHKEDVRESVETSGFEVYDRVF